MKLKIQGAEYPLVTPQGADLLDLMELKQQSKPFSDDGKGWGMNALLRLGQDSTESAKRGDTDFDSYVLWMGVLVFLSRRKAGDQVTLRDALRVPLDEVESVPEAGDEVPDEEGEADPTIPGPVSPATPESDPSADVAE